MAERRTNGTTVERRQSLREQLAETVSYASLLESQRDAALGMSVDLQERLVELENATEGWTQLQSLGGAESGSKEFTRGFLDLIINLARIYWIKNPLIRRGVNVKGNYVFGQGWSIKARHPDVDAVVQAFLDDPDNKVELFSINAAIEKERDLECEGNIFFVLFADTVSNGRVRIRSINTDEVRDIIRNPEDKREVWYYERSYTVQEFTPEKGLGQPKTVTEYYPDWRYKPSQKPTLIAGKKVHWEAPIYHIKVGGFSSWKFGCPEVYPALDWARAYKDELEDDATRSRALARFVWSLSTKGGANRVAAAKAKLNSTFATGGGANTETNPPVVAGSTFISGGEVDLKAQNIGSAFPPTDHSRPHRLMVASATGLPDTILAGDPDMGNLATAKTLDRPTELEMSTRRELWKDVLTDIVNFRIDQAALTPNGPLEGSEEESPLDGRMQVVLAIDPETNEPMDRHVDVDFPPILEHSTLDEIRAIVEAATLSTTGANGLAGVIPKKEVARMLLVALGANDIDEILDELEQEWEEQAAEDERLAQQQAQIAKDNRDAALAQMQSKQQQQQQPEGGNTQPEPPNAEPAQRAVQPTGAAHTPTRRPRSVRQAEASLLESLQMLHAAIAERVAQDEEVANDNGQSENGSTGS